MTVTLTISGNGLSFDQDVSDSEALRIMKVGMDEEMADEGEMEVSLRNEYLEFEKEVPSNVGMQMMNLAVGNGDTDDEGGAGLGISEIENLVDDIK